MAPWLPAAASVISLSSGPGIMPDSRSTVAEASGTLGSHRPAPVFQLSPLCPGVRIKWAVIYKRADLASTQ